MALSRPGYELVTPPTRDARSGGLFDSLSGGIQSLSANESKGIYYPIDGVADAGYIDLAAASTTPNATASKLGSFGDELFEYGSPITIFTSYQADALQNTEASVDEITAARLAAAEERTIERALWEKLLPSAGTDLNPNGAVDVLTAIGLLKEYAGTHYSFKPMLHFGSRLAPFVVKSRSDADKVNTKLVEGAGYTSTKGPGAVESGAAARWMWITGQADIRRDEMTTHAAFDQNTNSLFGFSERTYIVTTDGLAAAVRVNLS